MKVVVTGSSTGIGRSIAERFLDLTHEVYGLDIKETTLKHPNYHHIICDVSKKEVLPDIKDVDILVNNAGVQDSGHDIEVNLLGTMNCTEKYGVQEHIKSVVNICSASAHSGAEFPEYSASKGGILTYTKNVALRIAKWGATCNSISPGGVITDMNQHILNDEKLWNDVLNETILHKWATCEEIAAWVIFLTTINESMTAQDILIDNGEMAKSNFIW